MLRGKNVTSKMNLSYLGVRKEEAKCCLRFRGFKGENDTPDVFKGEKLH